MKTTLRLFMTICMLAAGSFVTRAQEKPAPPEGTFKVLSAKVAMTKAVKGAPYSATAVTETVQTLSDGNQIIRKNESKLYRDSDGRTRTEQTLNTIGKWSAEGAGKQFITINDPVAGWSASLDPQNRIAQKNIHVPVKPENTEWHEGFTMNGKAVTQEEFVVMQKKIKEKKDGELTVKKAPTTIIPAKDAKAWELQAGVSGDPRRTIEQLGKQTIEGVETIGTRSTYTIPAGEIGNTLPLAIVEETWYSPALQMMVLTRSQDPRSGATTYRLTNLVRNEPDRTLFEIPADYTLTGKADPTKGKPRKEEE